MACSRWVSQRTEPDLSGCIAVEALSAITASTAASEAESIGGMEGWSWLANTSRARAVFGSLLVVFDIGA